MAKKKVKNRKPSERYKHYKLEGDSLKRLKRTCPKCGPGIFLAQHKDRVYCGFCHYVEMTSQAKR